MPLADGTLACRHRGVVAKSPVNVQFNVYLPPGLVKAFKHRAVDEGRSLSAVVETALTDYLSRKESR